MMAVVVTLGDFLESADKHLAESARSTRALDRAEAVRQVRRLAAVTAQFLEVVTPDEAIPLRGLPDWMLAAVHMRESARMAKSYLGGAAEAVTGDLPSVDDPAVKHLTMAADFLAAGGDLLSSHLGSSPEGQRISRSDWAVLLSSEPLVRAVNDEVTVWAQRAVHVLDQLAEAPGQQIQGIPVQDLSSARELLSAIAATRSQTTNPDFDMAERRELLRALPAQGLRERVRPQPGESKADLCNEITASAVRLRAAGFAASQVHGGWPFLSSDAWMNEARASAIVTDIACGLTRLLADRSTALGLPASAEAGLRNATDSLMTACDAWQIVNRMWRNVKTDTRHLSSQAVTETTDLILRTGRLLNGSPDWAPGARAVAQNPASLARTRPALLRVLAAVHETVDAVTFLAKADLAGVKAADDSRRLYLPRRIVTDREGSLYVRLSGFRAHALMNAYHIVYAASLQAATALDAVALETRAPSKTLSLKRAAAAIAGDVVQPEPGYELDPKAFVSQREKYFDRPAGKLRDPNDLDPAEVIHAYKEAGLSVRECADRFMVFPGTIDKVLQQHGKLPRFQPPPARWNVNQKTETQAQPESRPASGPLATALKEMGIKDPGVYVRAAALDRAALDLVDQAVRADSEQVVGSAEKRRTAAQLAAMDVARVNTIPGQGTLPPDGQSAPSASPASSTRHARNR